jgi:uncharacterized alkaline shock family protein YloU
MEIPKNENTLGTIRIADEVVETIAAMAAAEVEGVAVPNGGLVGDIAHIFGKGKNSSKTKNASKGVRVEINELDAKVNMYLAVEYGKSLVTVAEKVQLAVKSALEVMTGLKALEVNVHVNVLKQAEAKEPDRS